MNLVDEEELDAVDDLLPVVEPSAHCVPFLYKVIKTLAKLLQKRI